MLRLPVYLIAIAALISLSLPGGAIAATITVDKATTPTTIRLSGRLEEGDSVRFKEVTAPLQKATLLLDSPGGLVREGLQIGSIAKVKGFATSVPQGATCASACGFIWLAGGSKSVSDGARVGFHAAYLSDEGQTISSIGNALVGAYLAKLGYEDLVIIYVTEAAPREMRWLNEKDAKFLGLAVTWGKTIEAPAHSPILSREEVREALVLDRYTGALAKRFPKFFEFLVDSVIDAERSGEYFEATLTRAIHASPEASEYINRLLQEAPDDLVIEHYRASLGLLRLLKKTDTLMCAAVAFPGEFNLDSEAYTQRSEKDLKPLLDRIASLREKALFATPIQEKSLTKREVSRLKKAVKREMVKMTRGFSRKEIATLMKPVKDRKRRDAEVFCRFSIAYIEMGLRRPDLLLAMTRGSEHLREP